MNRKNLFFLQQKINTIRSALFFNEHQTEQHAATNIISALKMDESGSIWFFLNNDSHLQYGDDEFPARLSFYRKGVPYAVNIYGCARVIRDIRYFSELAGVNLSSCPEIMEKVVVIKVSADAAEYHEWQEADPEITMPGIRRLFNWMLKPFLPSYEHIPAQFIFN